MAIQLSLPAIDIEFKTATAEKQINALAETLEQIEKKSSITPTINIVGLDKIQELAASLSAAENRAEGLRKVIEGISPVIIISTDTEQRLVAAAEKISNIYSNIVKIKDILPTVNDSLIKMSQNISALAKNWREVMAHVIQAQIVAGLSQTMGKLDTAGMSVQEFRDTVVDMTKKLTEFQMQLEKMSMSGVAGEGAVARQAIHRLTAQVKRLMKVFGGLDKELKTKQTDLHKFSSSVIRTVLNIASFIARTSDLNSEVIDLAAQLTLTRASTNEYTKMWAEANAIIGGTIAVTGASYDALGDLFRQLVLTRDITADFSKAFKDAGKDLEEFGLLAGALRIEPAIVSQLITIAKMTGISAKDMVRQVQALSGAIKGMAGGLLTFQDAVDILREMPALAGEMAVSFDREFVLKLSSNVATIAKAFVKHLGMSSAQAAAAAMNVAKTFAGVTGDIRRFIGGLSDSLGENTMLILEVLMRVGVGGTQALQMLSDSSGKYFGQLLGYLSKALEQSKAFPPLFARTMAIVTQLFGPEVAAALAKGGDKLIKTIEQLRLVEAQNVETSLKLRETYLGLMPVILEIVRGLKQLFFEFLAGMGLVGDTGDEIRNLQIGIQNLVSTLTPVMRSLGRLFNLIIRIGELIILPFKPLLSLISLVLKFTDSIEKGGGTAGKVIATLTDAFIALGGVIATVFYMRIFKTISLLGKTLLLRFISIFTKFPTISGEIGKDAAQQMIIPFPKAFGSLDKILAKLPVWGRISKFFGGLSTRLLGAVGMGVVSGLTTGIERRSAKAGLTVGFITTLATIAGAIIGSAIAPGIGTYLGMAIAGYLGEQIGEYVVESYEPPKPQPAETAPAISEENVVTGQYGMSDMIEKQDEMISELRGIKASINSLARVDRVNVNISSRGNLDDVVRVGLERKLVSAAV